MPDKETIKAVLASPVGVTFAALALVYFLVTPLVTPLIAPIQAIPGKLDIMIAKLENCIRFSNAGETQVYE
jgi:hypothetical protein